MHPSSRPGLLNSQWQRPSYWKRSSPAFVWRPIHRDLSARILHGIRLAWSRQRSIKRRNVRRPLDLTAIGRPATRWRWCTQRRRRRCRRWSPTHEHASQLNEHGSFIMPELRSFGDKSRWDKLRYCDAKCPLAPSKRLMVALTACSN